MEESTTNRIGIRADEAHLWYVFPDDIQDPSLLTAFQQFTTPNERKRSQQFAFDRLRRQYLITRGLCRVALSRYADVDPRDWRFERNEYGRPEVSSPKDFAHLRFNLSNTRGLVACLVTFVLKAGVDVEDLTRKSETTSIAERYFSPLEVAALLSLPAEKRRDRFFEYWTLKEAYVKARGMGLSIPLNQFSFHLDDGLPIRISFDSCPGDDPHSWQFALSRPSERHLMAVALPRCAGKFVSVEYFEAATRWLDINRQRERNQRTNPARMLPQPLPLIKLES